MSTRAASPSPRGLRAGFEAVVPRASAPAVVEDSASLPRRAGTSSMAGSCRFNPQFVLNVSANYGRKIGVGAKTEALRPRGIESAWPTGDDARNRFVRPAADEADRLFARDLSQRLDLLAHGY